MYVIKSLSNWINRFLKKWSRMCCKLQPDGLVLYKMLSALPLTLLLNLFTASQLQFFPLNLNEFESDGELR